MFFESGCTIQTFINLDYFYVIVIYTMNRLNKPFQNCTVLKCWNFYHIVAYLLKAKAYCWALAQEMCLHDSDDITQQ
jgi:hypothetical protein